jgi:hypothetical protein
LSEITFSGQFSNLFEATINDFPNTLTSIQLPSNIFINRVEVDDGNHADFKIPRNLSNLQTISFAPNTDMNEFKLTAAFFGRCRKLTTIDLTNTDNSDEQLEQLHADLNNKMPKAAITIKKDDQEYKTNALLKQEATDRIQTSGQQPDPTQLTITNDLLQVSKVGDSTFTVNLLDTFNLSHRANRGIDNFNQVRSLVFDDYAGKDVYNIINIDKFSRLSTITFSDSFSNLFKISSTGFALIDRFPTTVTSIQFPSNFFANPRVEENDGNHTKFGIPFKL